MNANELHDAAQELARPCVRLVRGTSQPAAGLYRPRAKIAPPYAEWSVVVAIHPKVFQMASITADRWLLVWTDKDRLKCSVGFVDDGASMLEGGEALIAREFFDLPPFDALARFGNQSVKEWLTRHRWDPAWGVNANFAHYSTVQDYEDLCFRDHPLRAETDCVVQVGGWPWQWSDEDDLPALDTELLAWTFADPEPWIEARRTSGVIESHCRIT